MDMAGLYEADADVAGDAAQDLAPADHLGNRRLVHAILQRHDITARRQVLADQERRPVRVVGFRADKGDVGRRFLGKLLRLGQVQGARLGRERLRPLVMRDAQPVFLDLLDVLRPRVDERHILAGLRHMRAGIAADRPGADDDDPLAHCFLPNSAFADRIPWELGRAIRQALEDPSMG